MEGLWHGIEERSNSSSSPSFLLPNRQIILSPSTPWYYPMCQPPTKLVSYGLCFSISCDSRDRYFSLPHSLDVHFILRGWRKQWNERTNLFPLLLQISSKGLLKISIHSSKKQSSRCGEESSDPAFLDLVEIRGIRNSRRSWLRWTWSGKGEGFFLWRKSEWWKKMNGKRVFMNVNGLLKTLFIRDCEAVKFLMSIDVIIGHPVPVSLSLFWFNSILAITS